MVSGTSRNSYLTPFLRCVAEVARQLAQVRGVGRGGWLGRGPVAERAARALDVLAAVDAQLGESQRGGVEPARGPELQVIRGALQDFPFRRGFLELVVPAVHGP